MDQLAKRDRLTVIAVMQNAAVKKNTIQNSLKHMNAFILNILWAYTSSVKQDSIQQMKR
jgi:hypothetical protein